MLTDEQIEKILYEYTSRQDEFSLSVISVIAERISKLADFDTLSPLDKEIIIQKDHPSALHGRRCRGVR